MSWRDMLGISPRGLPRKKWEPGLHVLHVLHVGGMVVVWEFHIPCWGALDGVWHHSSISRNRKGFPSMTDFGICVCMVLCLFQEVGWPIVIQALP